MEVNYLVNRYVPLIDTYDYYLSKLPQPNDTSLLSTTPEEIQRNLQAWLKQEERLHVVV